MEKSISISLEALVEPTSALLIQYIVFATTKLTALYLTILCVFTYVPLELKHIYSAINLLLHSELAGLYTSD